MRLARLCQHAVEHGRGVAPSLCPACGGRAELQRRIRRARYAAHRADTRPAGCGHPVPMVCGRPPIQCPVCRAAASKLRARVQPATSPVLENWAWQPPGLPTVTARPTPARCRARADIGDDDFDDFIGRLLSGDV